MQTGAPYFQSSAAVPIYRNKHGRDSEDEDALEEQQRATDSGSSTVAGGLRGTGRVHFSADQLQHDGPQFPSAVKRRKTGHLDFEPVFQGLTLDGSTQHGLDYASAAMEPEEAEDNVPEMRGRGRSGRRETTPFPGIPGDAPLDRSEHRRRSTSRNRARVRSTSRDATMSRYDPSRPHVVYVDTLSDSDEEDSPLPDSSRSTTIPSTRNNSPSSDSEEVIPPSSSAARPIHLNRKLRDYLRKQKRGESGPVPEGILASAPSVHGGTVNERGLVLYRPLSFGIVEEPDDPEDGAEIPQQDVRIQELPPDMDGDAMLPDEDTEMDGSMDID